MRYLEDLREGEVIDLGEETVSEEEILSFARRYDAQPFHVDKAAAAKSIYGGLIASGWQTGSIFMGLLVRGLLHGVASMGAPGLDELKWLKPVRPGDTLRARLTILSKRPSAKDPRRGTISCGGEMFNQKDELVMTIRWPAMLSTRPPR